MADFILTQTDEQVQSILDDAQDAQGAGAQTTLTTDYIMLKDTSGRYHKILKDSFTEACRNVLAGLLVNNNKGTSVSQIPVVASGDFGSVTPANLASVLGASTITDLSSIVNLADYKNKSEKLTWKAAARTPTDAPFTNCAGDCVVIKFAIGVIQIVWKQPDNFDGLYVNLWWGGNVSHWSGWKKIAVTNV